MIGGLGIGLAIAFGVTVESLAALRSSSRRRLGRVTYHGGTYERRSDGSFITDAGTLVTGAALVAALQAAWQDESSSSDDGGSDGDSGGGDGGD